MTAVKSTADRFSQSGINDDNEKRGQKLAGFEDDSFTNREFSKMRPYALPFAPMDESIAFAEGREEHDRKEIRDENVKHAASGIDDAFPGPGRSKD